MKKRVLFICTHNSCRSQMAEALLRAYYGDRYEVYSAGIEKKRVNPRAIRVLGDMGIDMSRHTAKTLQELPIRTFDVAVTVCNEAHEECPIYPGAKKILHKNFEDPSEITGTENEVLSAFRNTRDEIHKWIKEKFGNK